MVAYELIDGKKNELLEVCLQNWRATWRAFFVAQNKNLGASANLTDSIHQYVPILQQKTAQPIPNNKTATNTNCHLIPSLELSFYSYSRILIPEGTFESRGKDLNGVLILNSRTRALQSVVLNRTEYNEFQ